MYFLKNHASRSWTTFHLVPFFKLLHHAVMHSISNLPVMLLTASGALLYSRDGEARTLQRAEARDMLNREPHIICHKPGVIRHLGERTSWKPHSRSADILELFAFVFPARFCAPTPKGLALALELPLPQTAMQSAGFLYQAADVMLERLTLAQTSASYTERSSLIDIAHIMKEAGWIWSERILEALDNPAPSGTMNQALQVWNSLPEWKETVPRQSKRETPLEREEASKRLSELLGKMSRKPRDGQFDYTESAATAFACREEHGGAKVVLAEAGTGIGKTLGYLAAADIWSRRNDAVVWISTYTKNLQHQLLRETRLLFNDENEHLNKVVLRKGRGNYLCLLRLEEWLSRTALDPQRKIQACLIARWAMNSSDGAVIDGDFPSWLMSDSDSPVDDIRDRNQECSHGACPHHRRCFAEHTTRRARNASLVLVNHALVMSGLTRMEAAMDEEDEKEIPGVLDFPSRFIFDEGQHLFEVADNVFSLHCSGAKMARLRHWIIGPEGRALRSPRGLRARVKMVGGGDDVQILNLLGEINVAAQLLPGTGWLERLRKGTPRGPSESFLNLLREMILERDHDGGNFYGLDIPCKDLPEKLLVARNELVRGMKQLQDLLELLCRQLEACTDTQGGDENASRNGVQNLLVSVRRDSLLTLEQWRTMLTNPMQTKDRETENEKHIDLFSLQRREGNEVDVGMHRHWIDPTEPFARQLLEPSRGALITSATLHYGGAGRAATDQEVGEEENGVHFHWNTAEMRTGAMHLAASTRRISIDSPFDYKNRARIFLINDIDFRDNEAKSEAFGDLFLAAGGGGLGLFTSIVRLRQTYRAIAPRLHEGGIELFAQHVDAMDNATLMDVFRVIESSCLLGCDAVRDGIDVPGRSLQLVVLDKLPWPRTDVLHKARRQHFGGFAYDVMLTRFRLRQAFGRLIRAEGDRGVFVFLNRAIPARLRDAFPGDVPCEQLNLSEVAEETAAFLQCRNGDTAQ